jgi:hypothetical protein
MEASRRAVGDLVSACRDSLRRARALVEDGIVEAGAVEGGAGIDGAVLVVPFVCRDGMKGFWCGKVAEVGVCPKMGGRVLPFGLMPIDEPNEPRPGDMLMRE